MSGFRVFQLDDSPLWAVRAGYFSPKLNQAARMVPGMSFDSKHRVHVGYPDAVEQLVARLREMGLKSDDPPESKREWKHLLPVSYDGAREYQKEGIDFLISLAGSGALLGDDMGCGKSFQAVKAARALRRKTVIVCPAHVRGVWERPADPKLGDKGGELAKWWPKADVFKPYGIKSDSIPPEADVVVIHYDIVHAWVEEILAWASSSSTPEGYDNDDEPLAPPADLTVIFDECFPAGTPVRTPCGDVSIDQLQPGDEVVHALGVGRVEARIERKAPLAACRLVQTDDGREFIVTANHPVLTVDGWRSIEDLCVGDRLLDVSFTHALQNPNGDIADSSEALRLVSKDEVDARAQRVLLECLRAEEDVGRPEVSSKAACNARQAGVPGADGAPLSTGASRKPVVGGGGARANVTAESDVEAWCQEACDGDADGERRLASAEEGRERQTGAAGGANTECGTRRSVDAAVRGVHSTSEALASPLQDRHRAPDEEDRRRSGRSQPQSVEAPSSGSPSRRVSYGARVARVAVPQQADLERLGLGAPDDKGVLRVFNLQVSGHPSYAVYGFVAHNCHVLLNPTSRRSKACKDLAHAARGRIALTGTPPTERVRDLYNIVETISPGRFGEYFPFGIRYAAGHKIDVPGPENTTKAVWNFDGRSNLKELRQRLEWFCLRRTKREVLKELPALQRQIVDVEVPAKNRIATTARIVGDKRQMRAALDSAADGKLKSVLDLVKSHLEAGLRVVVGTYRRAVCERIAAVLAETAPTKFIHGGIPLTRRQKIIDELTRTEGACCLVANIDATSTGVDLTFAGVVVLAELVWEPRDLVQFEARVHRFGASETDPVLVQYVIARGTGDELILQAVINKLDNFLDLVETDAGDGLKETLKGKDDGLARLAAALKKMGKGG